MVNTNNSISTRLYAILLCIAMLMGMLPISYVQADQTTVLTGLGVISSVTHGGTITGGDTENVMISFKDITIPYAEADEEREGWYMSIRVNAPAELTQENDFVTAGVDKVTYRSDKNGVKGEAISFWQTKSSSDTDTVHYAELWIKADPQSLNEAKRCSEDLLYVYEFDWNGDGSYEQKITATVDADTVILKKNENVIYPTVAASEMSTVEKLTEGMQIDSPNGSFTSAVLIEKTKFLYTAADQDKLIVSDGWYAGIKIYAPSEYSVEKTVYWQSFNAEAWSEDKLFSSVCLQDDTSGKYYTLLWIRLTPEMLSKAAASSENISNTYRFDWDQDGYFEKYVAVNIDPALVVLEDSEQNWEYPVLGSVSTQGYGTVSGVNTELKLKVENTSIQPSDGTDGKEAGWWISARINAPSGYTDDQLKLSVYKMRSSDLDIDDKWTDYGENIYFADVKANDDDDRYMIVWMQISPELSDKYSEARSSVKAQYAFDWNGDGVFEQTVTLEVVPDGIVLEKKPQGEIVFENAFPADIVREKDDIAETPAVFENMANGGNGNGEITYRITTGSDIATVDDRTGKLTVTGYGKITVTATKAGDGIYADAEASYTVNVVKEFGFERSGIITVEYSEGGTFPNKAWDSYSTGDVRYAILGTVDCIEIDRDTGLVSILKPGRATVIAKRMEDDSYPSSDILYYVLEIIAKTQEKPSFGNTPMVVKYSETPIDILDVSGADTGKYIYSIISGENVAQVDPETGVITLKSAGSFTVSVKCEGNECYNESEAAEITIQVEKADRYGFAFEKQTDKITYAPEITYSQKALGAPTDSEVVYEIISGSSIANIDENGMLTVSGAGTVTVRATLKEDELYNAATAEYTLTIEQATPTINVFDAELKYGITEYLINAQGDGPFTYEISSDENELIKTLDRDTGAVVFEAGVTGAAEVTVKRASDSNYASYSKTVVIRVSYDSFDVSPVVIGDMKDENSGWYTSDIAIKAPVGYLISAYDSFEDIYWSEQIPQPITSEGDMQAIIVYLKNNEGSIVPFDIKFKIDKTAPEELKISYSETLIEKVLEAVTFGICKADTVKVTVSAEDSVSGISKIDVNGISSEDMTRTFDETTGEVSYTFEVDRDFKESISFTVYDNAGNSAVYTDDKVLVIDRTAPELTIAYEFKGTENISNDVIYTNDDVTVHLYIKEENFDLSDTRPIVNVNGNAVECTWKKEQDGNRVTSFDLSTPTDSVASYKLEIVYFDAFDNEIKEDQEGSPYIKDICIDKKDPVTEAWAISDSDYSEKTVTVKVTEDNFDASRNEITVEAVDINGKEIVVPTDYSDYIKDANNWISEGNVHTVILPMFSTEGIYKITVRSVDLALNEGGSDTVEFTVDRSNAVIEKIEYSEPEKTSVIEELLNAVTFGYYGKKQNDKVVVTVTVSDKFTEISEITVVYNKELGSSSINKEDISQTFSPEEMTASSEPYKVQVTFEVLAQARGYISVIAKDKAMNECSTSHENVHTIVVDTVAPGITVTYSKPTAILTLADAENTDIPEGGYVDDRTGEDVALYYADQVTAEFKIDEANFHFDDVAIYVDGELLAALDWKKDDAHIYTAKYSIDEEGEHRIEVRYEDRSGNIMKEYDSSRIIIDKTAPEIVSVTYDNNSPVNGNFYNDARTATVVIKEKNFRPGDAVLNIYRSIDVMREDTDGNFVPDGITPMRANSTWTYIGDDKYQTTVSFTDDGFYLFTAEYTDVCGYKSVNKANGKDNAVSKDSFVIDNDDPVILNITYDQSLISKVIEGVTFGFYKAPVTVTVTARDVMSGIDYFVWQYTEPTEAYDINNGNIIVPDDSQLSADRRNGSVSFVIGGDHIGNTKDLDGYITAWVYDKAGRLTCTSHASPENENRIVVDTISPEINVEYKGENDQVTFTEYDGESTKYYDGNVNAVITVKEYNFFEGVEASDGVIHCLGIKVTKTDSDGKVTSTEYLPEGSEPLYAESTDNAENLIWEENGNGEYVATLTLSDECDHVIEIDYTDFSENGSTYRSDIITVDKTAPVVDVKYGNTQVVRSINNRDYFDEIQTLVVTVTEHNFRADKFVTSITSKNILGETILAEGVAEYLSMASSWTAEGNVHTAKLVLDTDANYIFDCEIKDSAGNACEDFEEMLFTVDRTAPYNVTISYSQSVLDKAIEAITFGFYNAPVTVTVTAEDDVSEIYSFVYSYLKAAGVSGVNAQLTEQFMSDADIIYEGKRAVASFMIPKEALAANNQFNGTVNVTAYDRADNKTEKRDGYRIIVDNIRPGVDVTYSAPVKTVDKISYYSGNINARITVNEANFYSEDVAVTVLKNGEMMPVNVKWNDESTDVHTGIFTLTEDGDYTVRIQYTDRSFNAMETYVSDQMTIDTLVPEIKLTGIEHDSANRNETVGFVLNVTDIDLDIHTLKPVFTALVKTEDGKYETKTIELGQPAEIKKDAEYTYTVEDLTDDGIYALFFEAADMSGNKCTEITLNNGEKHNAVKFSVNRHGSYFSADKNTWELAAQYYVYGADNDVVIEEINTDPVMTYSVKVNGKALTEGTEFKTELIENEGEWSKRVYTVSKAVFDTEGEYSITVESCDKAGTVAFSDVKGLNVSFTVDKTPPAITVSGLESGGRYQTNEQTVTVIPSDDGGRLMSVKVIVSDSDGLPLKDENGNDISVRFDMSGEELLKHLSENGGRFTFTIPAGLENQVKIISTDCAVNSDRATNERIEEYTEITVSQNVFVIFYANKPLFYGSVAGVLAVIAALTLAIVLKNRKKNGKK